MGTDSHFDQPQVAILGTKSFLSSYLGPSTKWCESPIAILLLFLIIDGWGFEFTISDFWVLVEEQKEDPSFLVFFLCKIKKITV